MAYIPTTEDIEERYASDADYEDLARSYDSAANNLMKYADQLTRRCNEQ